MLDQNQAPLVEALREAAGKPHAPFYAPGHKGGRGIPRPLADLFGGAVFTADLPELPELDNLFAPEGPILEAQQLAAAAFGATKTWFLVNGSTAGVAAAILATSGSEDKIILPRNVHKSAISGLILSGAVPIFINPEYDSHWDLTCRVTPSSLSAALEKYPDAKAAMLVSPTYEGVCSDVGAVAEIAHRHDIPLLVDEAHGAHFAFHPELPTPALAAGADLAVQSIHKVLGAMTQASMLHIRGDRLDADRLNQALSLLQSSSPSYLLLASLDAARQQMALDGFALMSRTLQLAEDARKRISLIPGLSVLELAGGLEELDPTRLTVKVSDLGLTGYEADEILHRDLGVTCELPGLKCLTFIISLGNTAADIDRLVQALETLAAKGDFYTSNFPRRTGKMPVIRPPSSSIVSPTVSPRTAFFADKETLPVSECVGRISGESICPYPPGIPVLMPGEAIATATVEFLQQLLAGGAIITGCSDPTLQTLKVLCG
ncbi:MAG: aminotransferase class I/II-fold pyridoxal phosphate-dependent enzyme [Cyanobacteriota bacterium]|nr:aminotransferase class I/II-fold pyridoxal phosphate-dependent enzyme [Cyanobacteriota bacterium]